MLWPVQQGSLELYKEQQDDQETADHDQQPASDSDINQDVSFQDDDIIDDQVDSNHDKDDVQDGVDHQGHDDDQDNEHQEGSDGQGEVKVGRSSSRVKQNRKRKAIRKPTSKHKSKKIRIQ